MLVACERLWYINGKDHVSYLEVQDENVVIKELQMMKKVCSISNYHNRIYMLSEEGMVCKTIARRPSSTSNVFHKQEHEFFTTVKGIGMNQCVVASARKLPNKKEHQVTLSLLSGSMKVRNSITLDSSSASVPSNHFILNPVHVIKCLEYEQLDVVLLLHYYSLISLLVIERGFKFIFIKKYDLLTDMMYGFLPLNLKQSAHLVYGNNSLRRIALGM